MGFNKMSFTAIGLTVGLFASINGEEYLNAIEYYDAGKYDKAFPIILKEAKKGSNKAAQYRIAEMYEDGKGTNVDYKKSALWYKKAASKYAFVHKKEFKKRKDTSFVDRLENQIGQNSSKAGAEFALAKVDTHTPETKRMANSILDGDFFGLQPYHVNYILPASYSKDKPNRVSSNFGTRPKEFETYNEHMEVEFQLSLKKELSFNLFGWNEYIIAAYTQKVWWQLYDESGPFRETNYQPELFMSLPTSQHIDDTYGLKAVNFGFIHESNGQEGYRSRSWNRLYAKGLWQWNNLFLSTRVWYRLKEDKKPAWYYTQTVTDPVIIQTQSSGDDNPDIQDYLGYGDITIDYLYDKHHFGLLLRNNLEFNHNKGAVEFSYSYPFFDSPDTNWYVKLFNGYGNSLIDYNVNVTKASFGFSFSNGIF